MSVSQSCPYCGEQMGFYLFFHSGLGPPTVTCNVTGQPLQTGRCEWGDMGVFRRSWYCLVSVVYATLIGFWGVCLVAPVVMAIYGRDGGEPLGLLLPAGGFAIFCALGFGIQIARVRGSLQRSTTGGVLTHRAARRYFRGQLRGTLIFLGSVLITGLLSMWILGPVR